MALIGDYQRGPVFATAAHEARGEESTSASFTELPAAYKPRRKAGRGRPRQAHPTGTGSGWQWLRAHLAWVGVGVALVIGGVILGASLTSTGDTLGSGPPPPPPTACHSSGQVSRGPAVCMVQAAGEPSTTFVVHGTGFDPRVPVTVTMTAVGPPPASANIMDSTATIKPVTSQDGTLSFTVKQLFPSLFPLGLFTVEVTGSGGAQATTQFMVLPVSAPAN